MYILLYIYIYIYVCMYIYIYMYIDSQEATHWSAQVDMRTLNCCMCNLTHTISSLLPSSRPPPPPPSFSHPTPSPLSPTPLLLAQPGVLV